MAQKRTWDESRSPQWRYLLSKDSKAKREERAEGELKKGISKRKKESQERHREKRKLKNTKSGKEILYSASPGGEKNRYHNTEFAESHRTIHFNNTDNNDLKTDNH